MRNRDAVQKIAACRDFRGNNFRGEAGRPTSGGQLDNGLRTEGLEDADYVVYSYATPIAWHTAGQWFMTAQRFSQTTSRHQSVVREAVFATEV